MESEVGESREHFNKNSQMLLRLRKENKPGQEIPKTLLPIINTLPFCANEFCVFMLLNGR